VAFAGFHDDIAAASAVAARWTAARNKLFAAKCHAPVATVAGFYANFGFVDEHGNKLPASSYRLPAKTKSKINSLTADSRIYVDHADSIAMQETISYPWNPCRSVRSVVKPLILLLGCSLVLSR
jgi:hypothetical protein